MGASLFFVYQDQGIAEQLAAPYRARGWDVEVEPPDAADALERMESAQPLAAVFGLDSAPADGVVAFAHNVMDDSHLHRPLMVFLGGDAAAIEAARLAVPYGVFVRPEELGWVLKHLDAKD
jgi:hypothetical protein